LQKEEPGFLARERTNSKGREIRKENRKRKKIKGRKRKTFPWLIRRPKIARRLEGRRKAKGEGGDLIDV